MVKISKEFTFEAAHRLDWHKKKCQNLHGHSYKLIVSVWGLLDKNGVVVDYADLKKIVKKEIIDKYDHAFLNDYFENPTAEIMTISFASRLFEILKKKLKKRLKLVGVELKETQSSSAYYELKNIGNYENISK